MNTFIKVTTVGVASLAVLAGPVLASNSPLPPEPEFAAEGKKQATINLEVTGMV